MSSEHVGGQTAALSSGSPWRVLPLALLMAVGAYLRLTDIVSVSFEPAWFVVLLTGWMADRYGSRATAPLSVLGALTIAFVGLHLRTLDVYWGFATDAFLLAALASLAFGRPRLQESVFTPFLRRHWRAGLWLALTALTLSAFAQLDYGFDATEALRIELPVGAAVAIAALAATVRWRVVRERTGPWVALAVPLGIVLLANFTYSATDELQLGITFAETDSWLLVACFALCAFRILDSRPLVALLAVVFVAELAAWRSAPGLTAVLAGAGGLDPSLPTLFGFDDLIAWDLLINCVSAALLGVVLSAFWCERRVAPLRTPRAAALICTVFALQFVVLPAWQQDYTSWNFLVLGGLAYTVGLVGRAKAVFAGPLLILICTFLAAAFGDPETWVSIHVYSLPRLGPIVFVFGFFGVLSNRYDRAHPQASGGAPESAPAVAEALP